MRSRLRAGRGLPTRAGRRSTVALVLSAAILLSLGALLSRAGQTADQVGDDPAGSGVVAEIQRPGFVGTTVCAFCHGEEAEAWRGSHHALAMQEANARTVLGDFDDATFDSFDGQTTFFRRDGAYWVRTGGPDGAPAEFEIAYTFGVTPLQQYLVPLPNGAVQALGIAWDSRPAGVGQRWFHLYPDTPVTAGDPLHWTSDNQTWNWMCADCHSTDLVRGFDPETGDYATSWSEISVGCESCHGPGADHVAWAEAGDDQSDAAMGLPVDLHRDSVFRFDDALGVRFPGPEVGSNAQVDTCAACHSRRRPLSDGHRAGTPFFDDYVPALLTEGLYHADGQILDEVYVWGSFVQSRMFESGVVCSDCHEPHQLTLRAEGNAVCTQCHEAARFDVAAHHHHEAGAAGAQCVDCHMPAQTYMVVDPRRDHSFRVPRPDVSAALGGPDACTLCHGDRDAAWAAETIDGWTGDRTAPDTHFAYALDAGRRGTPSAWDDLAALAQDTGQAGIVRATALSLLPRYAAWLNPAMVDAYRTGLSDADPLVRLSAVAALSPFPPQDRLAAAGPLLEDEVRAVRIAAARQLASLTAAGLPPDISVSLDHAFAELMASERASAERPESQANIGSLFMDQRRWDEAEQAFRRALEIDGTWVPAYVNLADLQRARGREDEAEATLRLAIEAVPTAAEAYHALGLSLVRQQRYEEALEALATAWRHDPGTARFGYVYAVALDSLGQRPQALSVLAEVADRHPTDRPTLMTLAQWYRDGGDRGSARAIADRLEAMAPDDPEIRALSRAIGGG